MLNAYVSSFVPFGYHTETAGTAITQQVPGQNGQRLALIGYDYLAAATAHTMSIMYVGSSVGSNNTAASATLSGQKDIVCTNAPKDPAGNAAAASDIIAFQLTDGSWEWDTVASVSSSTITCTNNITGVDAGAGGTAIAALGRVLIFGVVGDNSCVKQGLPASTNTSKDDKIIAVAPGIGDPLYVTINNVTNAGFLNSLLFAYINK